MLQVKCFNDDGAGRLVKQAKRPFLTSLVRPRLPIQGKIIGTFSQVSHHSLRALFKVPFLGV